MNLSQWSKYKRYEYEYNIFATLLVTTAYSSVKAKRVAFILSFMVGIQHFYTTCLLLFWFSSPRQIWQHVPDCRVLSYSKGSIRCTIIHKLSSNSEMSQSLARPLSYIINSQISSNGLCSSVSACTIFPRAIWLIMFSTRCPTYKGNNWCVHLQRSDWMCLSNLRRKTDCILKHAEQSESSAANERQSVSGIKNMSSWLEYCSDRTRFFARTAFVS